MAIHRTDILNSIKTPMWLLVILIGVVSRLLPHPPNMVPMGAIALFSGAYMDRKRGILAVVGIMLITDLIIGIHGVMWATYGAYILAVVLGHAALRTNKSALRILGSAVGASLIFFLLTNFAVWVIPGSMYPKTVQGLVSAFVMAIPFFRNTITGDLLYTSAFFAAYEVAVYLARRLSFSKRNAHKQ